MKADKLFIFVAGVCVGAGIHYWLSRGNVEKIKAQAWEEAREHYRPINISKPEEKEPEIQDEKIPGEEDQKKVDQIIEENGYISAVDALEHAVTTMRYQAMLPEEFISLNGNEKVTLLCWSDGSWTNDQEELIQVTDYLGKQIPVDFLRSTAEERYILDAQKGIEYELVKNKEPYADHIGMELEEDEE